MVRVVGCVVGGCYARDVGVTTPAEHAATVRDDKGYSEETCVRCGWRMGSPPLNCQNDNTPHVFPSQVALAERATELERERDQLLIAREDAYRRTGVAEARAEQLETALRTADHGFESAHKWLERALEIGDIGERRQDAENAVQVVVQYRKTLRAALDGGTAPDDESRCHFCHRVSRPWVTSDETWALVEPILGQQQACLECFYDALPPDVRRGEPLVVALDGGTATPEPDDG